MEHRDSTGGKIMSEGRPKLKVLDLFSGIQVGGFSLGLERTGGFSTVAFCEIEPFPRKILAKHWPGVPCYEDVRTIPRLGGIDLVCGGYPCQPFSTAGRRQGEEDDRHLWPAMFSIIQRERPTWVIGENVAGHVSMGLDDVLSDLESEGYSARPFIIPACAADAPHRRDRVWIVANTSILQRYGGEYHRGKSKRQKPEPGNYGGANILANATSQRQSRQGQLVQRGSSTPDGKGQANKPLAIRLGGVWPTEPDLGGMVDGLSRKLDGGLNEKIVNTEGRAKSESDNEGMSRLRGNEESPAAPSRLFQADICGNSMPSLSREGGSEGWSQENKADEELQNMRGGIYAKPQQEAHDLQQKMSFRDRQNKCHEAVGWPTEPDTPRVANGIKNRADRLKSLGNAVVPAVVGRIGRAILAAEAA